MLTILIPHGDPLSLSQSAAVCGQVLVHEDAVQAHVGAHVRVSASLFRFLRRSVEEAEFVRVLAAVGGDAGSFQGAQDVVWTVGCGEVFAVFGPVVAGVV